MNWVEKKIDDLQRKQAEALVIGAIRQHDYKLAHQCLAAFVMLSGQSPGALLDNIADAMEGMVTEHGPCDIPNCMVHMFPTEKMRFREYAAESDKRFVEGGYSNE